MRGIGIQRGLWLVPMVLLLAVSLPGCRKEIQGLAQADAARLPLDSRACPKLDGVFQPYGMGDPTLVRSMTHDGAASTLGGTAIGTHAAGIDRMIAQGRVQSLRFHWKAPGEYDVRVLYDMDWINGQVGEWEAGSPEQYRSFYHLVLPEGWQACVERDGKAACDARLAQVAPPISQPIALRIGADFTCEDGWLALDRQRNGPLRMTLAEDGSIIGESIEDVKRKISMRPVNQCRDGCEFDVGDQDGTLVLKPLRQNAGWVEWAAARTLQLPPPRLDVEAARANAIETTRADNAALFLPLEAIRSRLAAIAPGGTSIVDVAYLDQEVLIRYQAPNGQEDALLERIDRGQRDDAATAYMVRRHASEDGSRQEVSFRLRAASPLVALERAASPVASPASVPSEAVVSMPTLVARSDGEPHVAGLASLKAIRRRLMPLWAKGCRIDTLAYSQNGVDVHGTATPGAAAHCIDDTLRQLAAAQETWVPAPQVSRTGGQAGDVMFDVRLERSRLLRE